MSTGLPSSPPAGRTAPVGGVERVGAVHRERDRHLAEVRHQHVVGDGRAGRALQRVVRAVVRGAVRVGWAYRPDPLTVVLDRRSAWPVPRRRTGGRRDGRSAAVNQHRRDIATASSTWLLIVDVRSRRSGVCRCGPGRRDRRPDPTGWCELLTHRDHGLIRVSVSVLRVETGRRGVRDPQVQVGTEVRGTEAVAGRGRAEVGRLVPTDRGWRRLRAPS